MPQLAGHRLRRQVRAPLGLLRHHLLNILKLILSGFDAMACAGMFAKLMKRLGHDKYYAQGGDWGAYITTVMAQLYSQ